MTVFVGQRIENNIFLEINMRWDEESAKMSPVQVSTVNTYKYFCSLEIFSDNFVCSFIVVESQFVRYKQLQTASWCHRLQVRYIIILASAETSSHRKYKNISLDCLLSVTVYLRLMEGVAYWQMEMMLKMLMMKSRRLSSSLFWSVFTSKYQPVTTATPRSSHLTEKKSAQRATTNTVQSHSTRFLK